MKKFLCLMLSLVLALSALFALSSCGGGEGKEEAAVEESAFDKSVDTEFTKKVMQTISEFGDDQATGNRSAGSPAEQAAGEYIKGVMEEIGLSNITADAVTVDGWTFGGANITYANAKGKEKTIDLGGYATDLSVENKEAPLLYLGKGTAADYEGVDASGKLVLIDINQDEEWWINYPAKQAQVNGALGVIAMSEMVTENEDRIGCQDICGPADAPAFAISQKDSKALQKAIKASDEGEIIVTFNADTTITKDATSHNIWGEIPGKTDEVIYMIGHYDGYYHSIYDNASGIATTLGIAKALIDSGYEPEKTIRIVAHGSEEFGKSGNEYDWGTGAYEQIMTAHPEWAENAFAVVNIDGDYPIVGEKGYGISTSHEILDFVKKSGKAVTRDSGYDWSYKSPAGTGTEDFQWTAVGIPSIVATHGEECIYYDGMYHSNMDSYEGGELDEEALLVNHKVFGKIVQDLDAAAVRPMSFTDRFAALEESINTKQVKDEELMTLIADAKDAAGNLEARMAEVEKSGDAEAIALMNDNLYVLFKAVQDDFLRIDYNLEVVFPTEQYQNNIAALSGTIKALEDGDVATAVDEHLWAVDWAWYDMYFDEETCQYFMDQLWDKRTGTWGDGRVEYRHCDVGDVTRSLCEKYEEDAPDVTDEIAALKELKAQQQEYLAATVEREKAALAELVTMMEDYSK